MVMMWLFVWVVFSIMLCRVCVLECVGDSVIVVLICVNVLWEMLLVSRVSVSVMECLWNEIMICFCDW